MLKKILSGISAGVCICLGGAVFLACENRIAGAILFSVALLCICMKGYALFTGKVGYIPEAHDKDAVSLLLLALLGNAIATVAGGYLIALGLPKLKTAAETICLSKLDQQWWETLIRGTFCGILMYLAVSTYRDNKTPLGIMFCIPVFILSGFEHSIADIFYFAASGIVSLKAFVFLWLVILGNSIGGMLLPVINGLWRKKQNG
ncbi:MAG: formate/nitrite transporter family protein [Clostridia bacterium]|jgi:formate/nitrite transporter FocA (FNT family)|nr:formate/nitrite transporter family protein [Clostridia bacterium]